MKNNTRFLLSLPLLCLVFVGCGDHEAELRRIRDQQNDRQIIQDPQTTRAQCLGDEDKMLMYGANLDFAHDVQNCVVTNVWAMTADLNKVCLKDKHPLMNDGCIDCFAELTKCTADNCKWDCMGDAAGAACEICSTQNCHEKMWNCSGLPSKDIPSLHPRLDEANTLEMNLDQL